MVLATGTYRLEKDENVKEHMKALGLPEEQIEQLTNPALILEVFEDGNKYTIKTNVGLNYSYVLNEEFQDPLLETAKALAKREGDVITVTTTTSDGRVGTRNYEYTEGGLIVALSISGVAGKRYFKRN